MLQSNRIPKLSLLAILFAAAYLALLVLLGQERAMDWGLTEDEAYPHEFAISLVAAAGVIATWFLGMYRAYGERSWRWFVACMFFWPVSYVYTLFFNTGHEA